MNKKRKTRYVDIEDVEKHEGVETEDIYDDEQREKMLDEDEITASENAFMQGREMKPKKRKNRNITRNETLSVKLAEDEYMED